ncbi:MAG TPA: alpha/beta hydrolase, partial [Anaerolineales bacterium]|nr:alpha/beta hydrolase [Anaerolineales bacterium]HNC90826.1 alpha/beta hydrolase [Anaerolineales bacterium]
MITSTRKSDFVQVNGIRLHYLDWGGNGPTLIFLTGMGSSAYIYGGFAPLFTDQFRVLALTRRGHGDSDYPETGYDADTLVEDIRQFMDALQIEKAAFAGHSIAGVELTHFAATHPERVEKLIYLDALDDRRKERVVMEQHPLRNVQIKREESIPPRTLEEYIANVKKEVPEFARIWSAVWDEEFAHVVVVNEEGIVVDKMPASIEKMMVENLIKDYAPKVVKAQIPILSFYGKRKRKLTDDYTEEQKAAYEKFHRDVIEPFFKYLVDEFQGRFPQAQIVVIPDGHHYCFMAQEELVHAEMRKFLLA